MLTVYTVVVDKTGMKLLKKMEKNTKKKGQANPN